MERFIVTKSHGDNCTIVQEETNHDTKNLCLMILDLLSHEMLQGWTARPLLMSTCYNWILEKK